MQPGGELQLSVDGMHCQGCVTRLTAALNRLPGVGVRDVQVGSARLLLEPGVSPQAVLEAVAAIGFTAQLEN